MRAVGAGQSHITTPIDTYIKGMSNTTDTTSLASSTSVGLILSRFVALLSVAGEALYPAAATAREISFGVSGESNSTTIEFVRRDTLTDFTPSSAPTTFSTRALHAAHDMPDTLNLSFSILRPYCV